MSLSTTKSKLNVNEILINKYKLILKKRGLKNELYKWQFIKDNQGIFTTQKIEQTKFINTVYQLAPATLKKVNKAYPNELIGLFNQLSDESIDLQQRINLFIDEFKVLYDKSNGEKGTHQDERSIATYLTMINPSNYTFYKNGFYEAYCKLLGEKKAKARYKYVHYLNLIKNLVNNYIVKDEELITMVNNELGDLKQYDTNYLLLAQDMLYEVLTQGSEINYWVFQANPKYYDIQGAINADLLKTWSVKAHKEYIKPGDKVILWQTGKNSGCFGLAEVTTDTYEEDTPTDKEFWKVKEKDNTNLVVGIEIIENFIDSIIPSDEVLKTEEFKKFKGGKQGTNFAATEGQYEFIEGVGKYSALRLEFKKWLTEKAVDGSNQVNSYIRALDILEKELNIKVYSNTSDKHLNELYSDLIENQREVNGKYWFEPSKSYNTGGYYSASLKKFMEFLKESRTKGHVSSEFYQKLLQIFDEADLQQYFEFLDKIIETYNIKYNDERVVYSWKSDRLNFTAGQRYAWNLYRNNKDGKFGVMSLTELNVNSNQYDGNLPRPYYTHFNQFDPTQEEVKNILDGIKQEVERAPKSGFRRYNNQELEDFIFNIETTNLKESSSNMNFPLNQILYGPPGTGKTYHTAKEALEICGVNTSEMNREELMSQYAEYVDKGQIVFTTFHQSMSYEDFVEGIKPDIDENNNVTYDVKSGVFKELASASKKLEVKQTNIDWREKRFFKMSLGGKKEAHVHDWCIENNKIVLGWGGEKDLSTISNISGLSNFKESFYQLNPDLKSESKYHVEAVYKFINMNIGDVVVVSMGNHMIDAVGIVEGSYHFNENDQVGYPHERTVKWVSTNMQASPSRFLKKGISQQSIYEFYNKDIIKDAFEELSNDDSSNLKNYVLIIDEINRGNVSAIFGELITLLETDKRQGELNEVKVTLPYSKETFSVPSNLHIIGTMNTADRSVEALDTALRRRFEFKELMPNPNLLVDVVLNDAKDINLSTVLKTINQRVELLLDRDHTIGHSHFFGLNTLNDLKNVFENKIIPQLQEYFFGDYGKIGLILGSGFIRKSALTPNVLANVEGYHNDVYNQDERFELIPFSEINFIEALTKGGFIIEKS